MTRDIPGALCASTGYDPELWFSDNGQHSDTAKRVCRECPVRVACLAMALEVEGDLLAPSRFGVYGGLDPAERAALAGGTRQPRGDRCVKCAVPIVTRGKPRPAGAKQHTGHGLCDRCYRRWWRARKAGVA